MCPTMDKPNLTIIKPTPYRPITTGPISKSPPSTWFEIRLFYVRISPCVITSAPEHLTLKHRPSDLGVSLEINNTRFPTSDTASSTLRRDRVDKDSSEVTYVSTDTVRLSGGVQFEVYEEGIPHNSTSHDNPDHCKDSNKLVLCGSLERMESEWGMDCYPCSGTSSFCQPKMGISSPSIEVYVAGRWADVPVILTKVVNVSPRRRSPKYGTLDSIPEGSDEANEHKKVVGGGVNHGLIHRKLQLTDNEDECEAEGKLAHSWYPEEVYVDEDGQLTWFNAGVRVGVGIGLGMCLGLGIGVGLLMRSYQTTTRNFRRRFF